jgi:FkbM family methyltransferase
MMALARQLADVLGLRPWLERPGVVPWIALGLRAACVSQPLGFAGRELLHRRVLARYRLRGSGLTVYIRHGTGDVVTLGEVFDKPDYAPVEPVRRLLGDAPRVLDLGANVGLFGAYALGLWPGATVTAFEPDPENAAVHRKAIEANGLGTRWRLVESAAAAHDGPVSFAAGRAALSHVVREGEGATIEVEARDVLPLLAEADLLKLDVEGAEWEVLGDPRFEREAPPAVVLEYHPEGAPGPPAATVEELFARMGYRTAPIWQREDGYGMLWAWRSGG